MRTGQEEIDGKHAKAKEILELKQVQEMESLKKQQDFE